jgi:hypothetical protein
MWLDHRKFNYTIGELSAVLRTTDNETSALLRTDHLDWASFLIRRDTLVVTDPVVGRVSDRMERATTARLLSPIGAEAFQVANYGLGGQYSQHLDPHGVWEGRCRACAAVKHCRAQNPQQKQSGDRLLTVMVYLSQV